MLRFKGAWSSGALALAAACGGLVSGGGGEVGADGGTLLPDAAVASPDGPAAPVCHAWTATSAPGQISRIPSSVELMSAIAAPSGVLVGYADQQFPPVDSSWHAQLVGLPNGSIGLLQTPFQRNSSGLGWTAISLAQGASGFAATASDQTQGMQFTTIDPSGVPNGPVARLPGNPGRYLLATSSGFSVLRSAFNASGTRPPPVELALLDASGNLLSTKTLLDASVKTDWYERIGLLDRSFLLVWPGAPCNGCSDVFGRHFAEDGAPLGAAVDLHHFGPTDYGSYAIAPTPEGFLFAWSSSGTAPYDLSAEPFGANGASAGPPVRFAEVGGANAPTLTLAAAPGGDLLAAWADGPFTSSAHVYAEAVAADGSAEGAVSTLAPIATSSGSNVLAVASPLGAMVLYEDDAPEGTEVFGVPLKCER